MKNNNKTKRFSWILIFIISMLTISMIVSITLIIFSPNKMQRRVVFFYDDIASRVVADQLDMRLRRSMSADVEAMVKVMTAPPKKIEWRPFFANIGQVTMVAIVGNVCYINFEGDVAKALVDGADFTMDLLLIEKSVRFNFRSIDRVVVSYNGLEAFI